MAMTATESTVHETQIVLLMTMLLAVGQFLARVMTVNSFFTAAILTLGLTYYSTVYQKDKALPLHTANSAARAAVDVIGLLLGIFIFLTLLVLTSTKLSFTSENLLTMLTGGGVSLGHFFLSIFLTYASNMSLFSVSRFMLNACRPPYNYFFGPIPTPARAARPQRQPRQRAAARNTRNSTRATRARRE